MGKILVLGATGNVGADVVNHLAQDGHSVKGTSRKPQAARAGVEWTHVEIGDKASVQKAFDGVTRAFLLSPPGYSDQLATLAPFIEEAAKRRIEKVVLMTAMGVDVSDEIPFRKAEILLERSGVPYNIVRPNWFMQNFNSFWIEGIHKMRSIVVPAAQAKVSFIDARDIAASAARLLVDDSLKNRAFTLTGPESLDHAEAARILGEATGLPLTYTDIEPEAFRNVLIQAGLPADYASLLLNLFAALRAGAAAPVSSAVETITGRKPRTLAQYAKDYRSAWV